VQYVHRVSRIGPVARTHWFDLLIAAVAIAAMVEVVVGQDRAGSGAPTTTMWVCVPAIALLVSPLFARRRFPFMAPAMYWVLAVAISFVDWRLTTFPISLFLAGMAASFLLGNLRNNLQAGIGLGVAVAGAVIVVSTIPDYSTPQIIFIPLQFAISWVAGFALRERSEQAEAAEARAAQAEHERETTARIAVAEERTRIARELHDVVSHAISVVVLQARGGRKLLADEPAAAREAFDVIEQVSEQALTEMRRLLGLLRAGDDELALAPQPSIARIDELVGGLKASGLPVEVTIEGDPVPLPAGVDVSAYRIVQEALTNALKHAGPARAHVYLRYHDDDLELEILDDGAGTGNGAGSGHGLAGIRERVAVIGGEMDTGRRPEGGYAVRARLPLGSAR
jgi:signal transduction histidine kinase